MSKISDERLESLLEGYYRAEPDNIPGIAPRKAADPARATDLRKKLIAAASLLLAVLTGAIAFIALQKPVLYPSASPTEASVPYEPSDGGGALVPTLRPEPSESGQTEKPAAAASSESPSETAKIPTSSPRTDYDSDPGYPQAPSAAISDKTPDKTEKAETQSPTVSKEAPTSAGETSAAGGDPTAAPETVPSEDPTDKSELVPTRELSEWEDYVAHQSLYGVIDKSMLTGSGKVYFRIYAFDGSPLGGEELFSDSNLAYTKDHQYNTVTASYYLGGLEEEISKIRPGDCLTYRFFNEDGDAVLTRIKIF